MKILVVDDSPDIRFLLRQVLEQAGFEVREADGGSSALESLANGQLPDLVVLDLAMPDMTGWDTLRSMRADRRTALVPVMACSVRGERRDVEEGWLLGCDGFVRKPFDVDDLVAEVHSVLAMTPDQRWRRRYRRQEAGWPDEGRASRD